MIARTRVVGCLVIGLACFGLLPAPAGARAADVDGAKLVGEWECTTVNGKELSVPLGYAFTKDGKMTSSLGTDKSSGTYKVKGNRLTLSYPVGKGPAVKTVMTIKKLTDNELVLKDATSEMVFKKKEK